MKNMQEIMKKAKEAEKQLKEVEPQIIRSGETANKIMELFEKEKDFTINHAYCSLIIAENMLEEGNPEIKKRAEQLKKAIRLIIKLDKRGDEKGESTSKDTGVDNNNTISSI